MIFKIEMVEERTIDIQIKVCPHELNRNIKETICTKVQAKYDQSCDKEYGYIINILDITCEGDNIIISSGKGDILFYVKLTALFLNPFSGLVLKCKINRIFKLGIFGNLEKLKILIPAKKLEDWTYIDDTYKNDSKILKSGDEIFVKIIEVKYEKKSYSCIAILSNE